LTFFGQAKKENSTRNKHKWKNTWYFKNPNKSIGLIEFIGFQVF
jgi:hypothetical protein